jgi:type VI protein secretion system component Hcp
VEFELANSAGTYLKYELKNVMISSYSVSAESGRPMEQFSINFEEIKVTYTEQVAGKSSGKVEYTWKVEEGVK